MTLGFMRSKSQSEKSAGSSSRLNNFLGLGGPSAASLESKKSLKKAQKLVKSNEKLASNQHVTPSSSQHSGNRTPRPAKLVTELAPQLPTRNLRNSVLLLNGLPPELFSQFESEPKTRAKIEDSVDRPNRSTTRPSSWMLMIDGNYAPPQKVERHQIHFGDEDTLHAPGDSRRELLIENTILNHKSAPPSPNHPQPSAEFKTVLADYHSFPSPTLSAPSQSRSFSVSRPLAPNQHSTRPPLPPTSNLFTPPLTPAKIGNASSYSPLAAFMGGSTLPPIPFTGISQKKESVPKSPSSRLAAYPSCEVNSSQARAPSRNEGEPRLIVSHPDEPDALMTPDPETPRSQESRVQTLEPVGSRGQCSGDAASKVIDYRLSPSIEKTRTPVYSQLNQESCAVSYPSSDSSHSLKRRSTSLSALKPTTNTAAEIERSHSQTDQSKTVAALGTSVDLFTSQARNKSSDFAFAASVLPESRNTSSTQPNSLASKNLLPTILTVPSAPSPTLSPGSQTLIAPPSSNSKSSPSGSSTPICPSSPKDVADSSHISSPSEKSFSDGGRGTVESTFSSPCTDSSATSIEDQAHHDEKHAQQILNLEDVLLVSPSRILVRVLAQLPYLDFFNLALVSTRLRDSFSSGEPREIVLERYLGPLGYYRRSTSSAALTEPITLRDLQAFYTGLEFSDEELAMLARQRGAVDKTTTKMVREAARAHNRVVIYIRANGIKGGVSRGAVVHLGHRLESVWRPGRTALLRVWVPTKESWMSNDELAECERELWRSQVWPQLRRGDVCWNTAVGEFANEGKLIYDGKYLRDLNFEFDPVGSLPVWLNMFSFPPAYYHNIIAASSPTPIFYLDLSSFGKEVQQTMTLCKDKVELCSPQARYRVQRWVYRAIVSIKPGMVTGPKRMGMADTVAQDWVGSVVIEVEGTSEHARELLKRCSKEWSIEMDKKLSQNGLMSHHSGQIHLTPWRIVRERCGPGKMWIRPVDEDEKI